MLVSKRGAALLQVLIITAILAGMSAMILRLSLSRTVSSHQARRTVKAQTLIEQCMAEVNVLWASKTAEKYRDDLSVCRMCAANEGPEGNRCGNSSTNNTYNVRNYQIYTCTNGVVAKMESGGSPCKITYIIPSEVRDNFGL